MLNLGLAACYCDVVERTAYCADSKGHYSAPAPATSFYPLEWRRAVDVRASLSGTTRAADMSL